MRVFLIELASFSFFPLLFTLPQTEFSGEQHKKIAVHSKKEKALEDNLDVRGPALSLPFLALLCPLLQCALWVALCSCPSAPHKT